jgi:hypothetical protein
MYVFRFFEPFVRYGIKVSKKSFFKQIKFSFLIGKIRYCYHEKQKFYVEFEFVEKMQNNSPQKVKCGKLFHTVKFKNSIFLSRFR